VEGECRHMAVSSGLGGNPQSLADRTAIGELLRATSHCLVRPLFMRDLVFLRRISVSSSAMSFGLRSPVRGVRGVLGMTSVEPRFDRRTATIAPVCVRLIRGELSPRRPSHSLELFVRRARALPDLGNDAQPGAPQGGNKLPSLDYVCISRQALYM